jgi:hypothetical protein
VETTYDWRKGIKSEVDLGKVRPCTSKDFDLD